MLRSADSLIASMRIKEALAVIDNYGLSALESRELASTKLNEPPYNLKTRYEIKAKVIQQKRSVLLLQLESLYKKLNIHALSDCDDPTVIELRKAVCELSEAQDAILREITRDFYLK